MHAFGSFFSFQPAIVLPNDPTFHCCLNGRNRWHVYDVYEKREHQVRACVLCDMCIFVLLLLGPGGG
jgi:hypothetical protein